MTRALLAAGVALALGAPAEARQTRAAHDSFGFVGTQLTIEVLADAPGTLRLVRGGPGRVDVRTRVDAGFAAAGLARRPHRLHLTAVGAERVEYIVVVPDDVRVHVRMPGRPVAEVFGTLRPAASFAWDPAVPLLPDPAPR